MNPWLPFYPSDWLGDEKLRLCSYAARGLWIDLCALMHKGEPYGHLRLAGRALGPREVSALLGRPIAETQKAWAELMLNQVPDVDQVGVWSSRRMVRDHDVRTRRAAGGKLGGNPALIQTLPADEKVNHHVVGKVEVTHAGGRALELECVVSLPLSEKQNEDETAAESADVADFERFWAAYPVPQNQPEAEHAWHETRKIRPPTAELLAALGALAASARWRQDGGRFVPAPAKWLRGKGWLDRPGPRADGFQSENAAAFTGGGGIGGEMRRRLEREAAEREAAAAAGGAA